MPTKKSAKRRDTMTPFDDNKYGIQYIGTRLVYYINADAPKLLLIERGTNEWMNDELCSRWGSYNLQTHLYAYNIFIHLYHKHMHLSVHTAVRLSADAFYANPTGNGRQGPDALSGLVR